MKIKEIKINPRIRVDLGNDFDLLKDTIEQRGMLQPIVVDKENNLIGGFRRLQAAIELGWKEVPVFVSERTTEETRKIDELIENLRRKGFNWQEKIKGIMEALKEAGLSYVEFGRMFGWGEVYVGRMLFIGRAAEKNPEIWNCETEPQAYGLASRYRMEEVNRKRMERKQIKVIETLKINNPLPDDEWFESKEKEEGKIDCSVDYTQVQLKECRIYNDALGMLRKLTNNSVDICVTDPPYNIDYRGTMEERVGVYAEDYSHENNDWYDLMKNVISELNRVLKPGSFCYVWSGSKMFLDVLNLMKKNEFSCYPIPLIWVKKNYLSGARTSLPGYYPGNAYEVCVMGWSKGERKRLIRPQATNVLMYDGFLSGDKSKTHPFEKPKELLKDLISRSALSGEWLVDPFAGTGSGMIAGLELGLNVIGAEQVQGYRDETKERVRKIENVLFHEVKEGKGDEK